MAARPASAGRAAGRPRRVSGAKEMAGVPAREPRLRRRGWSRRSRRARRRRRSRCGSGL